MKYCWKDIFIIILIILLVISYVIHFVNVLVYKKRSHFTVNDMPSDIRYRDTRIENKLNELTEILGQPNKIEFSDFYFEGAIWQLDYNLFNPKEHFGFFNGLDYIKISGHISKKWHPLPAIVYLIVGKYMYVPDHLIGPLKHASETINIEQLFIPAQYSEEYYRSGTKDLALVTGSCASVTISAITVKFCEDMISLYSDPNNIPININDICRDEYDRRVLRYLCNKGIEETINWYSPNDFNESANYNSKNEMCNSLEPFTVNKEGFSHCESMNTRDNCNAESDCNWSETTPNNGVCKPKPS